MADRRVQNKSGKRQAKTSEGTRIPVEDKIK
jgi:hypothetical protein